MAERKHVFGKYPATQVIRMLTREGLTKQEVRKVLNALGCDVAENTIKTQSSWAKNPKQAHKDGQFTPDEWKQVEQFRKGEAPDGQTNQELVSAKDLLRLNDFAKGFGGVERVMKGCETLMALRR